LHIEGRVHFFSEIKKKKEKKNIQIFDREVLFGPRILFL